MHIKKYDHNYSRRLFLERVAKGSMAAGVLAPLWPTISHSADITIPDAQLSRRHAEIRMNSAGQFELVDLDSTNLSIVNTHDVSRHILSHGDQILLGETELEVELRLPRSDLHDQTTRDLPRANSTTCQR